MKNVFDNDKINDRLVCIDELIPKGVTNPDEYVRILRVLHIGEIFKMRTQSARYDYLANREIFDAPGDTFDKYYDMPMDELENELCEEFVNLRNHLNWR